jgi:hypothetical protein
MSRSNRLLSFSSIRCGMRISPSSIRFSSQQRNHFSSLARPPGPVPVSSAERALWSERQERILWWNSLYKNGGDVFTLEGVSPTLQKWWPRLAGPPTKNTIDITQNNSSSAVRRVLIPGVGRDISAAWLARQEGWGVIGVDFADAPIRALGETQGGLTPIHEGRASKGGSRWSAYQSNDTQRLLLVHGDFLELGPKDYGGFCEAVWDRGALTSFSDRAAYVKALSDALIPGGHALFELLCADVTIEGATNEKNALQLLSDQGFLVETLEKRSVLHEYPEFRPPGLTKLEEVVILAKKNDVVS